MIDYTAILSRKYDAQWTLNGDDYKGLTWLSDSKKPTKAELDAQWETVKQEIEEEAKTLADARLAVLSKLGLTEKELSLLLG